MGFGQFRRFDVQAKYALVLSLGSVLPLVVAATLAVRNYDHTLGQIVHGSEGLFLPVFLTCLGLSLLAGAIGSVLGLHSAGRRRNERPAWSWIGFLVGSTVVASNLILLIAYGMLGLIRPA
ncbi:MAG: hypothetical protein IID33_12090 [Planctomycetes bacterium]|nr:hypothetical protein [Planctomycetota bacterium]